MARRRISSASSSSSDSSNEPSNEKGTSNKEVVIVKQGVAIRLNSADNDASTETTSHSKSIASNNKCECIVVEKQTAIQQGKQFVVSNADVDSTCKTEEQQSAKSISEDADSQDGKSVSKPISVNPVKENEEANNTTLSECVSEANLTATLNKNPLEGSVATTITTNNEESDSLTVQANVTQSMCEIEKGLDKKPGEIRLSGNDLTGCAALSNDNFKVDESESTVRKAAEPQLDFCRTLQENQKTVGKGLFEGKATENSKPQPDISKASAEWKTAIQTGIPQSQIKDTATTNAKTLKTGITELPNVQQIQEKIHLLEATIRGKHALRKDDATTEASESATLNSTEPAQLICASVIPENDATQCQSMIEKERQTTKSPSKPPEVVAACETTKRPDVIFSTMVYADAAREKTVQHAIDEIIASKATETEVKNKTGKTASEGIRLQCDNIEANEASQNMVQIVPAKVTSSEAPTVGNKILQASGKSATISVQKDLPVTIAQKKTQMIASSSLKDVQDIFQNIKTEALCNSGERVTMTAKSTNEVSATSKMHLIRSDQERSKEIQKIRSDNKNAQGPPMSEQSMKAQSPGVQDEKVAIEKSMMVITEKNNDIQDLAGIPHSLIENKVHSTMHIITQNCTEEINVERFKIESSSTRAKGIPESSGSKQSPNSKEDVETGANMIIQNDCSDFNNPTDKTKPRFKVMKDVIGQESEGVITKSFAAPEIFTDVTSLRPTTDSALNITEEILPCEIREEFITCEGVNLTEEDDDDVFVPENELKHEQVQSEEEEFVDAVSEASDNATFTLEEPVRPDDLSSVEGSSDDVSSKVSPIPNERQENSIDDGIKYFGGLAEGTANSAQDLPPTSEQTTLTSGDIGLSMTASPMGDRGDIPMEISFAG
uniref:PHD finger protein 10 n=1 Tax=Ascaris lumbricoides TaxID=6252 RepID=A0A0M3HRZ8_ASCLU